MFTFIRVSIPFTVSLIFQMSPWVARGVCDFRRRLKFRLIYSPLLAACLVEDGDCHCHHDLGIPCDGSNFFLHSVCWNAVLSLHFKPKPKLIFEGTSKFACETCYFCKHCFAAKFTCPGQSWQNKSITKHLVPSGMSVSRLEPETGRGSLCLSPRSTESQQPLP